jgi:hypothetical protein
MKAAPYLFLFLSAKSQRVELTSTVVVAPLVGTFKVPKDWALVRTLAGITTVSVPLVAVT